MEPLTVRKVWDLFIATHAVFVQCSELFKVDDNVSALLREQFLGGEVNRITSLMGKTWNNPRQWAEEGCGIGNAPQAEHCLLLYSWFSPLSLPSSVAAALWRSCSPLGSHTCRGANPNIRGSCCRSALEARILELFKMKTLLFNSSCAFKCEDGAGRRLALNIARPLLWMRGRGRGAAAITGEGRPPGCGAIMLWEEIDGSLSTALPARETGIGGYLGIPPASSSSPGSRAAAERSAEPGNGTVQSNSLIIRHLLGSSVSLAASASLRRCYRCHWDV